MASEVETTNKYKGLYTHVPNCELDVRVPFIRNIKIAFKKILIFFRQSLHFNGPLA